MTDKLIMCKSCNKEKSLNEFYTYTKTNKLIHTKCKECVKPLLSKKLKEQRHLKGISKEYGSGNGVKINKQTERVKSYKKRLQKKVGLAQKKYTGKINIDVLQILYEDNIKKYGTLTCIYCLKPLKIGEDTLEHKQPLKNGGTNNYDNLGVACRFCNTQKGAKTLEEYFLYLKRKLND